LPGAFNPELLAAMKPPVPAAREDKPQTRDQPSPSRSVTPGRGSPSRSYRSIRHDDDRGSATESLPSDERGSSKKVRIANVYLFEKLFSVLCAWRVLEIVARLLEHGFGLASSQMTSGGFFGLSD